MTIHLKAVERYFNVELFVFQCLPVRNFGNFFNFELIYPVPGVYFYDNNLMIVFSQCQTY